ncbi:glutathione synthetase [Photobacterium damselae]|uniref:glutathione synthetase n=1 Tax=Photobacterium damselae TaxID=38293 RepID=UPI002543F9A4
MKICFVMYPWDQVEPETDSTLRLIHEAASRGHTVAITTPNNLTMRDSMAIAFCHVLKKGDVSNNIPSFYRKAEFNQAQLPLAGFDTIFMRANPPLDTMALNFLDSVRDDTFIMNDIDGLRVANNKLYTASLPDPNNEFIPVTHVSKNRDYLERVLDESPNDRMILKPLNGYGGKGVILVEKSAKSSVKSLLDFYIGDNKNYVILQDYIEGAEQGDVRIMMLNGVSLLVLCVVFQLKAMFVRISMLAAEVKHTLTKQEIRLCKHIGPKLVRDGLYFVGLDVINGKLVEVNVLSPGGITRINRLNRARLQADVLDFVESVVRAKEVSIARKTAFRKVIEDASTF